MKKMRLLFALALIFSVTASSAPLIEQTMSASYGPPVAANTWQKFVIPLNADRFGVSDADFMAILANVNRLRIRTEMSDAKDTGGLDSVRVGDLYLSEFTSGTDGWTSAGDGTMSWQPGAGKPGGYLQVSDWGTGDWHWAVAPMGWSGNWTSLVGSFISFYYKTDHPDAYGGFVEISSSDNPRLTVTADPILVPLGGTSRMRVGLTRVAEADLVVTLTSSNSECLTVPEAVTIQRGKQDVAFDVKSHSSTAGCSSVITASATGYEDTRMTLSVGKSSDSYKNGVLEGRVTDALVGEGIAGAIVTLAGLSDTTDSEGRYHIEDIPTNVINANFAAEPRSGLAPLTVQFWDLSSIGSYAATATAEGYYRSETILSFYEGEVKNLDFSLSPVIGPGEYRLVLNWGAAPKDLDLHVKTPVIGGMTHEVYWNAKGSRDSAPYVFLDIDRQDGFGPETITISKMFAGTYQCFVENYSISPSMVTSYAVVQMYGSEGLLRTINIPTSGSGVYWHVCDIDGSTGAITVRNTISDVPLGVIRMAGDVKKESPVLGKAAADVVSWAWDFDSDGIVDSYEQNPQRVFYKPGLYTVTLRVSDGTKDFTVTQENYISVQPEIVTDVAWFHQGSGTSNDLQAVFAVDSLHAWAAGSGGAIVRTWDGGENWNSVFTYPQFTIYDLFFTSLQTGWAIGTDTKQNAVILKSDDQGAHWTRWNSSSSSKLFANWMVSATNGWNAGQDGKIEKTVDGGANWSPQNSGISGTLRGIFFYSNVLGWAVGDNGLVLKTVNGGDTWALQTSGTGAQINDVFFTTDRYGYAVTADGKVLYTTNGGTTWGQRQVSTSSLEAVYFDNTYYGYVVGAYGRIYKTLDAGDTWTMDVSGTSQHLHALHIVSNTCAYAVGDAGTILRLRRGAKLPGVVTNLRAETLGPNNIQLEWTNPSDRYYAGTVVQRKTGSYPESALDGIRVHTGTGNSFVDSGLAPKTTYYYAAFAYNAEGLYSSYGLSSRAYATTQEGIALYGYNIAISSIDAAAFPLIKTFVSVVDSITLTPVTGLTAANFKVKEDGHSESPITVEMVGVTSGAKADIVFIFDTTGSMGGEIDGLKARATAFADGLAAKGIDYRLALVTFGDEVDQVQNFTTDITAFKSWIEGLTASGGGDTKENALEGLARAATMGFRAVSQKIAILITDAPYHQVGETGGGTTSYSTETMIALLKEKGIMTNVVGPDEPQFHQLADGTGGLFFDINGDFQSIIDRISTVLSSQYVVSYTTHNKTRDNTWRDVFASAEKGSKGGYDTDRYYASGEIQNVAYFYSTAISYDRVYCRWVNPVSGAYAGVKVVRKTGGYPESPIDGALIYDGSGSYVIDAGLVPETLYYYRAFAYNGSGQVASPSAGAQGTARTWSFWTISAGWTPQPSGFKNDLYAVFAVDTLQAWVGGADGAQARTSNGGTSWESRFLTSNRDVFDLYFINGSTGWLAGQENDDKGLNMKTNSAGYSWTAWPSSSDKSLYANYMISDLIGWNAGRNGHIEKTENGGASWTQQYHNTEQTIRDLAFANDSLGWAVGDNGLILRTVNGGINWMAQSSGTSARINGVCFASAFDGWAVTQEGRVLRTRDGGVSWISESVSEASLNDVHFADYINGCAVGDLGRIYRTRDGGISWVLEASGTVAALNAVHLVSPVCGWAVGDGGVILKLGRTGEALSGLSVIVNSVDAEAFPVIKSFVTVLDAATRVSLTGLTTDNFKVHEDGTLQSPITVSALTSTSGARADIVFVFDVTGSMGEEIAGLISRTQAFADVLTAKGIDFQLGLVTFGDVVEEVHDFTADAAEFKAWMEGLTASGGGDVKENALEGLARATRLSFRNGAQKMAVLITDADYHQAGESGGGTTSYTTDSMIALLRDQRIITHVVGPDNPAFHSLAEKTSGLWFNITADFTGIIDGISSILSSQYVITYTTSRPTADNTWRQVAVTAEKEGKGGYDIGKYYVGSSRLAINPSTLIGIVDNFLNVTVDVENVSDLALCHFVVTYNPAKIGVDGYSAGDFLSQGGAGAPLIVATDDKDAGRYDLVMTRTGVSVGVTGGGTLLNVRLKVLAEDCTSDLGLASVDLRSPVNSTVPVTPRGAHIQAATTAGLLGDFDKDLDIDLRDFTLLSSYWQPVNDAKGDIGPAGGTVPALVPVHDGIVNFEDLFVFTRMWNWYQSREGSGSSMGKGVIATRWQVTPMPANGYACELYAEGIEGLAMAHLRIHFDAARIRVKEIHAGELLQQQPAALFIEPVSLSGVEVAWTRLANRDQAAGINGDGPLLSLVVETLTPDVMETRLDIEALDLRDAGNASLSVQKPASENVRLVEAPVKYELSQNYPNPFNGRTEVRFALPQAGRVKITVLNILGQPVRTLVNERLEAGTFRRIWDGCNDAGQEVVSGVYLLRLEAGSFHDIKRMAFVK